MGATVESVDVVVTFPGGEEGTATVDPTTGTWEVTYTGMSGMRLDALDNLARGVARALVDGEH